MATNITPELGAEIGASCDYYESHRVLMVSERSLREDAAKEGVQCIVLAGIVVDEMGRILILRRKADDFMPGFWELPSGRLENGESFLLGLVREVKEETGLDLAVIHTLLGHFDYFSKSGKKTRQFTFWVQVKDAARGVCLTEHDDFRWLSPSEASRKVSQQVQEMINRLGF